ncbi:MAG: folate family ECF transporter S component [Firmicutes bacterium]|nr:folate family ECF transporter S component [Bacillota bacterium]
MKKTHVLVFVGILIATEIVLTRYCAIQTDIVRIGFGFIPIVLSAMLFGPVIGGTTAMLADILGMMIFPRGAYFPGFTFSALVGGVIYGLVLYNKPKTVLRIFLAVLLVTVIRDLGLNTLWLSILSHKAVNIIMVPRILKSLFMLVVQVLIIPVVWRRVGAVIESNFLRSIT